MYHETCLTWYHHIEKKTDIWPVQESEYTEYHYVSFIVKMEIIT